LGCCAAGLLVALLWIRPLTLGLLATGAAQALIFPLGYASVGLVVSLRRPGNPIGWLYAASGLVWALAIPFLPWVNTLIRDRQPLALAAQLSAVSRGVIWAPAIALGVTLPFLLLPDGRLRSRRWRLVVAAVVAGVAMFVVGGSLAPGQLIDTPVPMDNPFGLMGSPARSPGCSSSAAWSCMRPACWPRWPAWCCAFGPPVGWNASSCAGSPPAPPSPCWCCCRSQEASGSRIS
jgi:hypothetical protein